MSSDVLIIGGGVIGLSIARELHKEGVGNITVLERGACGNESSWAAAGMLSVQAEIDTTGLFFDLCSESRDLYPQFAAELLDETGIDIELDRTGTLCVAFDDSEAEDLLERCSRQRELGLDVETLTPADILKAEPQVSSLVRTGLYFAGDWQVDNRKLCQALNHYTLANGTEIRENTSVTNLIVENGRVAGAATDSERFYAEKTIIATGAWTSLIKLGDADLPFEIEPVRGQMIAFDSDMRFFSHVIHSARGYMVPRSDGRLLAGSTTEKVGFNKDVTAVGLTGLREMACEIVPAIEALEVVDHWSGLRPRTIDSLPVLGLIDAVDDLLVATGHYRNGILLAPITATMIADRLVGDAGSQYLSAFAPSRFQVKGIVTAAGSEVQ